MNNAAITVLSQSQQDMIKLIDQVTSPEVRHSLIEKCIQLEQEKERDKGIPLHPQTADFNNKRNFLP